MVRNVSYGMETDLTKWQFGLGKFGGVCAGADKEFSLRAELWNKSLRFANLTGMECVGQVN